MHLIDPMHRERAMAVLVYFRHRHLKLEKKVKTGVVGGDLEPKNGHFRPKISQKDGLFHIFFYMISFYMLINLK